MESKIQSRRQFAESFGRFTLVAAGAALAPILSSCSNDSNPASSKEEAKVTAPALTVDLNQAPELKAAGGFKSFQLNATPIVIMNSGNNTFKAFSLVCTHQACTVAWTAAKQGFECPCHGSRYDSNGKVTQGPAASPLQSFTVEYRGAENTILVYA